MLNTITHAPVVVFTLVMVTHPNGTPTSKILVLTRAAAPA